MSEDISLDIIKKTQKILGKHVKKPPLTDKLLKKPPFRFLHDIIKAIIKETGFLKGLYSDSELNSDNVKEKDAKINFLNKLIEAIKYLTNTKLNVRAGKIVAGLEPENTNLLLQAIGKAVDSKVDSTAYIKQLNSPRDNKITEKKTGTKKGSLPKNSTRVLKDKDRKTKDGIKKNIKTPAEITPTSKRSSSKESPKLLPENNEKTVKGKRTAEDAGDQNQTSEVVLDIGRQNGDELNNENKLVGEQVDENDETNPSRADTLQNEDKSNNEIEKTPNRANEIVKTENNIPIKSAIRPKSARPKSGESLKIKTNEGQPLEMTVQSSVQRPRSSLRPPSVRPSSARPGAPRLRPDSALPSKEPTAMGKINVIVENVDNVDDEDTVVIENTPQLVGDAAEGIPLKEKGHLVEQILEQIKEGEKVNESVDLEWETTVLQNKQETTKELTQLRTLIQNLTKAANPLGKLMNYLHEDLDAMYSELQTWTNTKKQLYAEIQKQKRLNVESNQPLLGRLEKLRHDIKKQQEEITNMQSNILKNDMRIKELVGK